GGHSLLATRVIARLRQAFDIDVPLRRMFEAPTVVDISSHVEYLVLEEIASLTDSEVEQMIS
ncbi:phosphopantetheine-binding protein, partial [Rhizobium sp. NPDC090279]|uniref:phosphopantetheine-binding protein n=1 Tax=Rhizobium sp. NPDC090279 TaxID=3364499 RepID=UPI00383A681C